MMKRLASFVLMVSLVLTGTVIAPRESRADGTVAAAAVLITSLSLSCTVLAPVCKNSLVARFITAMHTRAKIYQETMMSTLSLKYAEKLAQAQMTNDKKLSTTESQLNAANQILHGPTGASCAIGSIGQTMNMGGRANTGQVTASGYTGAGSMVSSTKAAPTPFRPARDSSGRRQPVGTKYATDTSGADKSHDQFVREQVSDQTKVAQDRADGNLPGSETPALDAKTQFDDHQVNYGPDQTDVRFQNADIRAETILSNDTFPIDVKNTPKLDKDDPNVNTSTPRTLQDAAIRFCQNISRPTILAASRGQAVADSIDRQIYGNERNGWDARLGLVDYICTEAVARRTPKAMNQSSPVGSDGTSPAAKSATSAANTADWFTNTVIMYRKLNCVTSVVGSTAKAAGAAAAGTVVAGAAGGVAGAAASVAADNAAIQACQAAVDKQLTDGLKVSELEMLKTVYTKLLFTPQAQQLLGGASQNETMKMMMHLDQLDLALGYRIYEMQQKLALVKAAQLATMVEGEKGSPSAVAPK